ncbi:molybdenum cofactor guanylyltransferase [Rufibacter sediminis]|uniref:Probable molybdenum cofactor guanylyltransferase n=1 Tax=Rufibacter sediminis TaxID=2762756 RepID=A0ABR6VXD3_9BACT|nr:NTP transferase domain-containing protein [Rufibacter sediminis]MBC3541605.1 NTP transferase domain-containing protein [Rufibacter sediminis]
MQPSKNLFGLVLSGGQSSRMGQDKGLLQYHGVTQRAHLYSLLQQVCERVYLSLRPCQEAELEGDFQYLLDELDVRGPLNGILSALQQHPQAAWLVVACDLPLVNASTLEKLVRERDSSKIATAYATTGSHLPEPLVAIWEPAAFAPALAFTETGKTCPRKFLLHTDIKLIHPADDEELYNANSPEEFAYITQKLHHGQQI